MWEFDFFLLKKFHLGIGKKSIYDMRNKAHEAGVRIYLFISVNSSPQSWDRGNKSVYDMRKFCLWDMDW
jgi:hypothetical protein